jgi:hypothetical protein
MATKRAKKKPKTKASGSSRKRTPKSKGATGNSRAPKKSSRAAASSKRKPAAKKRGAVKRSRTFRKKLVSPGYGGIEIQVREKRLSAPLSFDHDASTEFIVQSLYAEFRPWALDVFRVNRRRRFLLKLITEEKFRGSSNESGFSVERFKAARQPEFNLNLGLLFNEFASNLQTYLKRKSIMKIQVTGMAIELVLKDFAAKIGKDKNGKGKNGKAKKTKPKTAQKRGKAKTVRRR